MTLLWLKRPALALVTPVIIILTMVASALKKYPFADVRTSTFWLVAVVLLMFIAAAGLARAVSAWHNAAGIVVVIAALALAVHAAGPSLRTHDRQGLFDEDVRAQVHYLDAHRGARDVVVVDWGASYGFAYYEHAFHPGFVGTDHVQMGYYPTSAQAPRVILMRERRSSDVRAALVRARRALGAKGGKIWIVRSHSAFTPEGEAWKLALAGKQVEAIEVGPEDLVLYRVPPRSSR